MLMPQPPVVHFQRRALKKTLPPLSTRSDTSWVSSLRSVPDEAAGLVLLGHVEKLLETFEVHMAVYNEATRMEMARIAIDQADEAARSWDCTHLKRQLHTMLAVNRQLSTELRHYQQRRKKTG
jgi:hypothetical protein